MIAALFVETNGVYFGFPEDIDPWDIRRDARTYKGPHRVIAHPPCERWGRYWSGGPSVKQRKLLGDDMGCFAHALWAVRTFGGVLEHPEASSAWSWFGLAKPPKGGGWVRADKYGWTCCVEQGHYGHPARKATWLYYVGAWEKPELIWGKAEGKARLDEGFHSKAERKLLRESGQAPVKRLSKTENLTTPIKFRNLLINLVGGYVVT